MSAKRTVEYTVDNLPHRVARPRRSKLPTIVLPRQPTVHDVVAGTEQATLPEELTVAVLLRTLRSSIQRRESALAHATVRMIALRIHEHGANASVIVRRELIDIATTGLTNDLAAACVCVLVDCDWSAIGTLRALTIVVHIALLKSQTRDRALALALFGYQTACSDIAQRALQELGQHAATRCMFDARTSVGLVRSACGRFWSHAEVDNLLRWILIGDVDDASLPLDVPEHDVAYRYLLFMPVVQAIWRRSTMKLARGIWSALSNCARAAFAYGGDADDEYDDGADDTCSADDGEQAVGESVVEQAVVEQSVVEGADDDDPPRASFERVNLDGWCNVCEKLSSLVDSLHGVDAWILPYLAIALRTPLNKKTIDAEIDREYEVETAPDVWPAASAAFAHGSTAVRIAFGAVDDDPGAIDTRWRWALSKSAPPFERFVYKIADASVRTIAPLQLYLDHIAPRRTASTLGHVRM